MEHQRWQPEVGFCYQPEIACRLWSPQSLACTLQKEEKRPEPACLHWMIRLMRFLYHRIFFDLLPWLFPENGTGRNAKFV